MLRILIVEDEYLITLVASTVLEAAGHHVLEAFDGEEALKIVSQEQPELIITDYMMPRLDGLQLIHKLRETGFDRPIILATAIPEDSLPSRPKYDAYLSKPYREADLLRAIRPFLPEI
jgi:CheY-like chemotaxis protein